MRSTSTMLVIWMFYLTTVCYESSEGMMSHLMEDDLSSLYSMVQQGSALKNRVRRATADDEDKRSPLPRLGARAEGEEGEEEEEEDERGNARDKRLPRFGREEEKEMDKRLPRLGIRSPLPRLGEEKEKRLPRLGIRSYLLPHLANFKSTEGQGDEGEEEQEEEQEEEEDENFDGEFYDGDAVRAKRLPRFGLIRRRASPFPRLGRAAPFPRLGRSDAVVERAAPFPRLGRASPFPRLGRSSEYYDFQEVEDRAAPFPRLGRASPFPRLG